MLKTGEYVIRDESEVLTVEYIPDVLLMRNGEYTKLKDTDVILGKLEIGNVYYNSKMCGNITLTDDIPYKDYEDDIVIGCTFGSGSKIASSMKYLSEAKFERRFNVGDKVDVSSGCGVPSGTGVIVMPLSSKSYKVDYGNSSWYVNDDQCSTHVEPEVKLEFNIGDKVTIVTDTLDCISNGDNGEIVDIDTDVIPEIPYKIRHSGGSTTWVAPGDIELTKVKHKFKVGDKVKMVDDSQCNDKGTGEIVELDRENIYDVKLLTLDTGENPPKCTLLYEEFQLELLDDVPDMTSGDWVVRKIPYGSGEAIEVYNCNTDLVAATFVDKSNGWFRLGNRFGRTVYNGEQRKYQK